MVFYIKLNHNKRKMDARNGTPKTPKKKFSKKANHSKSTINSSGEESEDEMSSQVDVTGIDSIFQIHNESSNDADDWNSDDDTELIQKIKATCRTGDKSSYKARLRTIDWGAIAFKKYSGTECEKRFKIHLKNVRRHRILSEIVNDVESNIKKCPIKKPLNAYQIFVQDQLSKQKTQCDFAETMRNLSTRYNQLSVEQRAIYERKALQLRSEYNELKQAYKSGNFKQVNDKKQTPSSSKLKTPFMLYLDDAKLENADVDTSKLREKYANLSLDEKYKYVVKAVSLAPDVNQKSLLNKEEQRIFKGQVKSAPTAYCLFVKETFPKLKEKCDGKNVFSECSKKWKTLSEKQKKMYTEAAKIIKAKTKKEQEAFNQRHGVTPTKIKKRRSTFVEQNTETEEALFTPPLPPPKKRKVSVSTQGSESGTEAPQKQTPKESEPMEKLTPTKVTPAKQSPAPMTVIHTPLSSMEKKRLKFNSETSDSNFEQMDSDAIDSTTPSDTKKKSKKEKKNKKEKKSKGIPPPDPESKPPADLFTYFAENVHTGKPRKARKAFDKLTKAEKKQINGEYNEKVDRYVTHLKEYLATLPKEEAVAFIKKVKAAEDAEKAAEEGMENSQIGAESSQEY